MSTLGTEGFGMTSLKLAYIKRYENPKGVWRHYFNKRGRPAVALPGLPGSEEFMEVYQACLKAIPAPKGTPKPAKVVKGSVADLIAQYYASADFKGLGSDLTRSSYKNEVDKIGAAHGDKPVALLDRRGVKKIIAEKADRPGAANKLLRTIRMLMKFAVNEEMRIDDPTAGIKPLKVEGDGFIAWTEKDIAKFEAKFPIGTKPRLALALALYTAQRRGDVVRMHRQHVTGDKIAVRQQKTGAYLDIPIHPELDKIIKASVPAVALVADGQSMTFLVSETGRPFQPASFGNWFGDRCREAGLPKGYNAHGLRKASARRLAEAGCTAHEIMSITGHQTLAEVERYTKSASQRKMSESGMKKMRQRSKENKE